MEHHHEHDENCGCGHHHEHGHEHHHHEHDENCGCGHHHEHGHKHHHHEHGDDCGCGYHHEHGHEHHHEHGDDCDCGCNHDHEHEHHHHDPNAPYIIDGHTHEGASVGTGMLTITGHYQELKETMRKELKALADRTTEQGGIIGHIKSSLVSSHTTMLSITEDEVNTISQDTEEIQINMAAIVFAVPLEEVKAQVEDICKKLVQMTGSK